MGILGAIGNAFLDSMESQVRTGARNKRLPDELRQQYSEFGECLDRMRHGEADSDEDD